VRADPQRLKQELALFRAASASSVRRFKRQPPHPDGRRERVRCPEWVGRARWHHGSFFLWGDVPALMPMTTRCGVKVGGMDWNGSDKPGYKAVALNDIRHAKNTAAPGSLKGQGLQGEAPRPARHSSRKAAAARIARIPFALARHIAQVYFPSSPPQEAADHARMPRVRFVCDCDQEDTWHESGSAVDDCCHDCEPDRDEDDDDQVCSHIAPSPSGGGP